MRFSTQKVRHLNRALFYHIIETPANTKFKVLTLQLESQTKCSCESQNNQIGEERL